MTGTSDVYILFDRFDTDHDGRMSPGEYREYVTGIGCGGRDDTQINTDNTLGPLRWRYYENWILYVDNDVRQDVPDMGFGMLSFQSFRCIRRVECMGYTQKTWKTQ